MELGPAQVAVLEHFAINGEVLLSESVGLDHEALMELWKALARRVLAQHTYSALHPLNHRQLWVSGSLSPRLNVEVVLFARPREGGGHRRGLPRRCDSEGGTTSCSCGLDLERLGS